jgi:hypothetical protein
MTTTPTTLTGLSRRLGQLSASFNADGGDFDADLLALVTTFLELRVRVQLVCALNRKALRDGRITAIRFQRANRLLARFADRAGLDPRAL